MDGFISVQQLLNFCHPLSYLSDATASSFMLFCVFVLWVQQFLMEHVQATWTRPFFQEDRSIMRAWLTWRHESQVWKLSGRCRHEISKSGQVMSWEVWPLLWPIIVCPPSLCYLPQFLSSSPSEQSSIPSHLLLISLQHPDRHWKSPPQPIMHLKTTLTQ